MLKARGAGKFLYFSPVMARRSRKREFEETKNSLWEHFAQSPTMQNAVLVEINRAGEQEMEKRAQLSTERNPKRREQLKMQADHYRELKQELQGILQTLHQNANAEVPDKDVKG